MNHDGVEPDLRCIVDPMLPLFIIPPSTSAQEVMPVEDDSLILLWAILELKVRKTERLGFCRWDFKREVETPTQFFQQPVNYRQNFSFYLQTCDLR